MYKLMLEYYTDTIYYFDWFIELLLGHVAFQEIEGWGTKDEAKIAQYEIDKEIYDFSMKKRKSDNWKYVLTLSDKKLKEYFSYRNEEKVAMLIFAEWLEVPECYVKEIISYRRKDVIDETLYILRRWWTAK